jgi:hypothetical protein
MRSSEQTIAWASPSPLVGVSRITSVYFRSLVGLDGDSGSLRFLVEPGLGPGFLPCGKCTKKKKCCRCPGRRLDGRVTPPTLPSSAFVDEVNPWGVSYQTVKKEFRLAYTKGNVDKDGFIKPFVI